MPAMPSLRSLIDELLPVHDAMARVDAEFASYLETIPRKQQASARNLLHYLALRCHDLRHAQSTLAAHGLSSLGRTESHVRSGVASVLSVLHTLEGGTWNDPDSSALLTIDDGEALLAAHTQELFGPSPGRSVRIMVTMPSEAATDYPLVRDLVAAGMDCMRINCAHDDASAWDRMIEHLTRANRELRRDCRVCVDIAGPKLRTGPIGPGRPVLKIKPSRDELGRVVRPALVALVAADYSGSLNECVDALLRIADGLPGSVKEGDTIELQDARGRRRHLNVKKFVEGLLFAELERTAYVIPGSMLRFQHDGVVTERQVAEVPKVEQALVLNVGDTLVLTPDSVVGRPAVCDERGQVLVPAQIGVTIARVFDDIRPGEAVWFDDGRIGGVVRTVEPGRVTVAITHARTGGDKLRSEKGINLPDTTLHLDALTEKDLEDLVFIAKRADMVGYSFVRTEADVHRLQQRLAELNGGHVGIVLKIETRQAFEELPRLLLACMKTGRFGVMIARGDLAIECGYERMAEVQEEILWIAEAAHTPVIWGTQVLESLAKTGVPSRAEVTDAAMAERAECVMLNKGPFIREAVRTLDDILRRMQAHQTKKRAMLRPLRLAQTMNAAKSSLHESAV
jgi:pyruvate kinase